MATDARVNLGRVNGFRLDKYSPKNEIFTIQKKSITDQIEWSSVEWSEDSGRTRSTLSFILRGEIDIGVGFGPPVEGDPITYSEGSALNDFFSGNIVEVNTVNRGRGQSQEDAIRFRVRAQDKGRIFDKGFVTKVYPNTSASVIAQDIIAASGLTPKVQPGAATINNKQFKYVRRSTAMRQIAEAVDWAWFVDGVRVFFVDPANNVMTATNMTEAAPNGWDFDYVVDGMQLRNKIIIEGRGSQTAAAVSSGDTLIAVESTTAFNDLLDGGYDGIAVIGHDQFTFTGVSATSGAGNITGIPAAGAGEVANDYPIGTPVNIIVIRQDAAAQTARAALEGGDGVYESYFQDRRLNADGAAARGDEELQKSTALQEITFMTRDETYRPGASFTVTLPTRLNISGDTYVVKSQRTRWKTKGVWDRQVVASKAGVNRATFPEIVGDSILRVA